MSGQFILFDILFAAFGGSDTSGVFGGMENISYLLAKITEKPYFMGNIGIGLSSQQSITEAQIAILNVHRLHYLLIAATLPILAIGASGLFHVAMKLVWQDKFITKKRQLRQ